jgi:hypothetical protein
MSSTVALTGLLPFVVLVASVLAYPVTVLLLRLYRRSVQKGMHAAGGVQPETHPPASAARAPANALEFVVLDGASHTDTQAPAYRRAISGPWRATMAYAIAGVVYAAVMTTGWLIATRDPSIVWIKLLVLVWTYCWPAVLAVLLVAAYDPWRRLQVLSGYFGVLGVLIGIAIARNPDLGPGELPLYWVLMNGPSTLLLATFLLRSIRAVGPLVLAFLIAISIGSQSLASLAATNEGLLRRIAGIGYALGLNAMSIFVGMMIAGVALFALLGWPLLRLIGRRYEQKTLSDQSITLDALWLFFGVVQSIGLAFEGPLWILTGVAAFAGYKLVSRWGLRWTAARAGAAAGRMLLLLRVFALRKRSERLFVRLRTHWRYAGSISMIAGPDLVMTTVEPHEFLEFLSGRLGRQFVRDAEDLKSRVAAMDVAADPDGLHRINEFFCHSDTWQMTMERLAARSDAVVMDLRSFSDSNQGCIFELGRLVERVDIRRVVFLVDDTTDRGFLESTLQCLWRGMRADSPNHAAVSPKARLFRVARQSERELAALLSLLLGAPKTTTA